MPSLHLMTWGFKPYITGENVALNIFKRYFWKKKKSLMFLLRIKWNAECKINYKFIILLLGCMNSVANNT